MNADVEQAIEDFNAAMVEYGETCTIERSTAARDSTGSATTVYAATDPPQTEVVCWVSNIAMAGGLREREIHADEKAVSVWIHIQVPITADVKKGDRITLNQSGKQFEVKDFGEDSIGISQVCVCVRFEGHR